MRIEDGPPLPVVGYLVSNDHDVVERHRGSTPCGDCVSLRRTDGHAVRRIRVLATFTDIRDQRPNLRIRWFELERRRAPPWASMTIRSLVKHEPGTRSARLEQFSIEHRPCHSW